jgi:5-methylcytosine-specific restriction endonuclease McrA
VDHIVPHRGNRGLFWARSNWQSLCATCHNSTKQGIDIRGYTHEIDSDGYPIDKNHPANKKRNGTGGEGKN